MLRATVNRVRRGSPSGQQASTPNWFQTWLIPRLQTISRATCTHPIHTITIIAILASTTYIALLETSLFEPPTRVDLSPGQIDISNFLGGSKTLRASQDTEWKWQNGDDDPGSASEAYSKHDALLTLVFPEYTNSENTPVEIPRQDAIAAFANASSELLPPSKNFLSPISSESTLTYSVPYDSAGHFIASIHELPARKTFKGSAALKSASENGESRWMMTAMRPPTSDSQRSFKRRVSDAWTAFTDLLKNAEELDIVIMVLGYLSMHLTFVSLFMSLRRLGSHFWLGTTTLLSSAFALLFGLIVTIQLGVPLNMVLLSEGLPFLVVTIGFEKPIILTKAVLSSSFRLKGRAGADGRSTNVSSGERFNAASPPIQSAIRDAINDKGYEIVRDYAIEILILIAGAASGVQGGLCQFCFLAAWILFFDCILLFTFYTAILTIKLEVNRIKRHVALRRALEEDGTPRRVAEDVAARDEWPRAIDVDHAGTQRPGDNGIFGMKSGDSSVSKFKVLMVAGFIAINLLNFCTMPFRSGARSAGSALSSAVTQPPMDPFKVAGSGLDQLLSTAKRTRISTAVTVLTPIKFELSDGLLEDETRSMFDMDFADRFFEGVGGRMVESILKSFEDPFLSKWIIIALVMSIILNGYLFNAARWTIKEATQPSQRQDLANGNAVAPRRQIPAAGQPPAVALDNEAGRSATADGEATKLTIRDRAEMDQMLAQKRAPELNDEELIDLALRGKIPGYALERTLGDKERAVKVRRGLVSRTPATAEVTGTLEESLLPYRGYDYDKIFGACCENVIGHLPLPVGVAGPLNIDGRDFFLPMATTEGVLVASTSRGAKAINAGGGAITVVTGDGMTRGPCVGFNSLTRAGEAKLWLDSDEGQRTIKEAFNSTSRFARLQSLKTALAGTYLYIRFKTTTGDAMGMNMISKGCEKALAVMSTDCGFDDMQIISLSGNYCTDKKPAAINWIDGRGKSVVAEAIIPREVVQQVLKSDVEALVELNMAKNFIGSAMAGSIGGFNAHAANLVAALFLATGQDPAQVVESSQCITVMKNHGGNLQISVSLPCMEVGTIGGGTFLGPQSAMLDLLGVRGACDASPGDNARQLARIIAAAVLAGELSLNAALAAGHLVKAHMAHNRSTVPTRQGTPQPQTPAAGPSGVRR